ncbi:MAG: hypothetical protein K2W82_19680 [Candidatus Obscuribacterales bacterium]|nr:hypothetical protein [Candidatus Obscuribacterales bacterium]
MLRAVTPVFLSLVLLALAVKQSEAAQPAKKKAPAPKQAMLVPPPPPSIPTTLLGQAPIILGGEIIEYMNKDSLTALKAKMEVQLARQKKHLDEDRQSTAEKKKRLENFEQLLAEGVVSKKEVAAVRDEAEKIEENLPQLEDTVKELESRMARINKRLNSLNTAKNKNPEKQKTARAENRSTPH